MSTVLIVDDHASFRAQARARLESDGFVVVGEAFDARSAIQAVATLHPDVVLLDIGLPDMDGFEAARLLVGARPSAAPAVVLTSSRDAAAYGPRLAESPAAGFLAKDELSGAALSAALAGRRRT